MSRHTVVVLVVALLTSLGGMGVAVVAFGQDAADQDAGVPIGDYTGTTPRQAAAVTSPTSGYTTTTTSGATTTSPTSGYTTPTTPAPSTVTAPGDRDRASSSETTATPSGTPAGTPHASSSPAQPSRVTRAGPTRLAFTGAEPMALGGAGAALMLAGLALHLRRRKATHPRA